MKIFISWSGEPSRSIAQALYTWLPAVVQHVDPWMSDEGIESGRRWNDEIASALDGADFGLVCVTRDNQERPWLMFEAGALAKRFDVARVVPLCIDLTPAEITSPLSTFQARVLNEEGLRKLVLELSAKSEKALPQNSVKMLFDAMWPELEAQINAAKDTSPVGIQPARTSQDMLEELVERVRRIDGNRDFGASRALRAADLGRLRPTLREFLGYPNHSAKELAELITHDPEVNARLVLYARLLEQDDGRHNWTDPDEVLDEGSPPG